MSTLTSKLYLSNPANGDESWGDEYRNAMNTLDYLACQSNVYKVDPGFTVANLYPNGAPTGRRHFDTIQGAIDQAESDGTNDFTTIMVAPAQYAENLAITEDMAIVGMPVSTGMSLKSPGLPRLYAAEGSSAITLTQQAGTRLRVSFANFVVQHNQVTAGTKITGYGKYLYMADPGSAYPGSPNIIALSNMHFVDNSPVRQFESGIKVIGYNNLYMDQCSLRHSTGASYYMDYNIMVQGNLSSSKPCFIGAKRSNFMQNDNSIACVRQNNYGNLQFTQCVFEATSAAGTKPVRSTGTGGQNNYGTMTDDADAFANGNILGVSGAGVFAYV